MYADVASPSDCINVANSLYRDLFEIKLCCLMRGIKLNSRKNTQSLSVDPEHPIQQLTLCRLDDKLTFDKHILNIASYIVQKPGLICKCYKTLGNKDAVLKSFYAFVLPWFEY